MRIKLKINYKILLCYIFAFPLFVTLGGIAHELLGHALFGVLAGGKLEIIYLYGFEFTSDIKWVGWLGSFAGCQVSNIPTETGRSLCNLAGSGITFIISIFSFILFWFTDDKGIFRLILFYLSLWCFDMFFYLLPCFGIPHYIIAGPAHSEPYNAAIKLGINGPLFIAICFTFIFIILTGVIVKALKTIRQANFI